MMSIDKTPSTEFGSIASQIQMSMTKGIRSHRNSAHKELQPGQEYKLTLMMNNKNMLLPQFESISIPIRMLMMKVTRILINSPDREFQRGQEYKSILVRNNDEEH
jgi:hypothetical protein